MEKQASEIRILLVEDEEELSNVVALRLRNRGYQVVCTYDGSQTMEKIVSERIDLVLLDVLLPDIDGHELCKRMRSEAVGYQGPIIFMSCMGDSENIVGAFREGGNDYIVKPVRMEVLIERIHANLADKKETQEDGHRLWFRQFMIDTKTRSVYRVEEHIQQEKIELSRTEYDILQEMVRRPEEILLYRQLYQAVWGMEDIGDVRTLMVHVSNLRKKVDKDHADMIQAIRGVGYLFQDK